MKELKKSTDEKSKKTAKQQAIILTSAFEKLYIKKTKLFVERYGSVIIFVYFKENHDRLYSKIYDIKLGKRFYKSVPLKNLFTKPKVDFETLKKMKDEVLLRILNVYVHRNFAIKQIELVR